MVCLGQFSTESRHSRADTEGGRSYSAFVLSVRTASSLGRSLAGLLLAVLLAVRLLAPAGFMPAFEHGAVTIVACPDALSSASAPMHQEHGKQSRDRQACPYASVSSLGATGTDWGALVGILIFGSVVQLGRAFVFMVRPRLRARPPTRGPPLSA